MRDTYRRLADGSTAAATGGPTLAELLPDGERIVGAFRRWLGFTAGAAFHCTDAGNAQRFAAKYADDVRYVYAWHTFLVYDGTRWTRDPGDGVMRRAKTIPAVILAEAAGAANDDARKQLAAWALKTESEPALRRMLELAKSEPGIRVTPDQLDAGPWVLNCLNGTLELRTLHLRPHRREDLLTKITAAPFEPAARHPVLDAFLESSLPDEAARGYVQRAAGYAMTGDTTEECLFLVRGPTAGGKTTFNESLAATLGDYAATVDFTSLTVRKDDDGPRPAIAKLAGVRLVTSSETRVGRRLDEGLIKLLTGGDTIETRRLYENTLEFRPQFKLFLASNTRPWVGDEDDALWRRIREIQFPLSLPEGERDPAVKRTLTDPAQAGAAILAWAAEGCHAWFTRALGTPKVVVDATADYRRAMDPLSDSITEICILEAEAWIAAKDLRESYETWCRENGIKYPVAGRDFANRLRARGCTPRSREHKTIRGWHGIRLRTVLDPEPEGGRRTEGAQVQQDLLDARAQEEIYGNAVPRPPVPPADPDEPDWVRE